MATMLKLHPGDNIRLNQGYGIPATPDLTVETIAYAGKRYLITASGVLLTENDDIGIVPWGRALESFDITDKARQLQEALTLPIGWTATRPGPDDGDALG